MAYCFSVVTSKGHRFDELKQKATTGSLFLTKGRCLISKFPQKVLDAFSEITVLTYLFEASTLAPCLRANGLSYEVLSLDPLTRDIIDRDDICEEPLKKEIRTRLARRTGDAIRRALEAAGVEFTNGERRGVRVRGGQ